MHVDDVDQFPQLLDAKVERGFIALEHGRDTRKRRIVRRRDVERVDVEAAAGKHPGDARQNAKLVLNEDRDRVSHEGWKKEVKRY